MDDFQLPRPRHSLSLCCCQWVEPTVSLGAACPSTQMEASRRCTAPVSTSSNNEHYLLPNHWLTCQHLAFLPSRIAKQGILKRTPQVTQDRRRRPGSYSKHKKGDLLSISRPSFKDVRNPCYFFSGPMMSPMPLTCLSPCLTLCSYGSKSSP